MTGIKIIGTGSALPAYRRSNDEVEAISDYDRAERGGLSLDEWAQKYHGGRTRYVATTESTADLATEAGRRALENAGMTPEELDLIVLATFTGDYRLPQAAGVVQDSLGIKAKFLQIDSACSGFVDGLIVACSMMNAFGYRNSVVIAADVLSMLCNPKDFITQTVFGDGAGAVVLRHCRDGEFGLHGFSTGSDGDLGKYVFVPGGGSRQPLCQEVLDRELHYWQFSFSEIHRWALPRFQEASEKALAQAGLAWSDISLVIPHQASSRLIEQLAETLCFPHTRIVDIYPDHGNLSGASIPVALDITSRGGGLQAGDWFLMPAVGAGMAWGAVVARWEVAQAAGDLATRRSRRQVLNAGVLP